MINKIASNTISQIISKFLTAFISIFLIGILTKYLSTEMYGQYNKIYNYLSFFAFFADLGLYTICIREISKNKVDAPKIIGNAMTLRLILGISIIFLSIIIAFFLPGYNTELALISIFIVSIYTIYSLLNSSVLSLMQAFMKIEFSLFSLVFGKLVNFLLILLVVFILYPKNNTIHFDTPFLLIMLTGLIGIIINYYLNLYYANKIVKIKFLFDFDYIKHLFKISLPYGIALFLSMVYLKIDIIILSLMEPTHIADRSIALYSLPMKIIEVLMIVGGFFLNSILPSLSLYFKNQDKKNLGEILKNSFRFLFSFGILVVVFGFLFGRDIILILGTPDYLDSSNGYTSLDAFFIVLFILLFYFISALFNYIFISSKNEKILLNINIFVTIFNIIGNIIFIPLYSFIGAGLVTLASQLLLFILGLIFSRKIIKFKFEYVYIVLTILLGVILYGIGIFIIGYFNISHPFFNMFFIGSILFILSIIGFYLLNRDLLKKKLN